MRSLTTLLVSHLHYYPLCSTCSSFSAPAITRSIQKLKALVLHELTAKGLLAPYCIISIQFLYIKAYCQVHNQLSGKVRVIGEKIHNSGQLKSRSLSESMWLFKHNKWVFHGFSPAELLHFLSTMRSAIKPIALLCLELP